MTAVELDGLLHIVAGCVIGFCGWFLIRSAAKAVGDWLIRWRIAGHHCNHCKEEKR